jgi:hypothetical protein
MPRFKPTPEKPLPGRPGRPSTYSETIADEIVRRMIEGENMTKICEGGGMPSRATVYGWFDRHPEFYARCARAREALADHLVDKIEQMADNATLKNIEKVKLKISVAQWRAMKVAPRMYGDRMRAEITGENGGPVQVQALTIDARALMPEHREALKQALLAAKNAKGEK